MRPLPSVKRIGRPDVVRMIEKLMDLKWILLLGFIIRISISPFFADSNDFPYWASIASDVSRGEGIYSGYALWYPPVWGYAISLMTPILDLFDCIPLMELSQDVIPDNNLIGEGWLVSVGAVVILKLPLMACDVVNGLLIYVIVKQIGRAHV